MVESEETDMSIILTEYGARPDIGEEVEFEIVLTHGIIANCRRVDDHR